MPDVWQRGDWLLIDAAGPALVLGLFREGEWLDSMVTSKGCLESMHPGIAALLDRQDVNLEELNGALYGCGPGSTLGLRLAAMFIRSLMELERLKHWACLQYNDLEVACMDSLNFPSRNPVRMAAPWRRECMHLATVDPVSPDRLVLGWTEPEFVIENAIPCVDLGNRPGLARQGLRMIPFPVERLPEIFRQFPHLLHSCHQPQLYSVHDPALVRWNPERHRAR